MSSPSTSALPFQCHSQCDNTDKVQEEQLLSKIVQEKSREKINTPRDYETISQKSSQPAYLSTYENETITSEEHSKENRSDNVSWSDNASWSDNSTRKFISCNKTQSSKNTIAIDKLKTELLQEISSKLDVISFNMTKILTHLAPEESLLLKPDNLPPLPLNSVDDYEKFEDFLTNSTNFSTVVHYFAGRAITQGNDWQSAVYIISKLLINNKLARAISWGGTKDTKIAIANSKIMEAVYCAVLKNHPKSDLKLVKIKVQRWLYTGNQRKI